MWTLERCEITPSAFFSFRQIFLLLLPFFGHFYNSSFSRLKSTKSQQNLDSCFITTFFWHSNPFYVDRSFGPILRTFFLFFSSVKSFAMKASEKIVFVLKGSRIYSLSFWSFKCFTMNCDAFFFHFCMQRSLMKIEQRRLANNGKICICIRIY